MNGFGEDFDQSGAEAGQFGARKAASVAGRTDARVEKRLVGVDVAHPVKERLVQQRGFHRRLAVAEERDEIFESGW